MKSRGRVQSADGRGQSEALGFVLVFSILIIGALVVVGLGATAIGDTEKQLADDRAEQTLTQFDSKAGLVALEESDSQRVSLPDDGGEQFYVREDAGWMKVVIENRSTGKTENLLNKTTLGAVTYENGGTTFAYQGGGVWRATENGGQMLSPPEFHYRNGTLTLPAVTVTGDSALDGSAVITQNGTTKTFPTDSLLANETNPLEQFEVRVVVGSDYYRGWGQYFEERTDGAVKYNDSAETATLELVAPADFPPVEAGLYSGATGSMSIENAEVWSYNSSTPGPVSKTSDTKVKVVSDLILNKQAKVHGDIEIGGELRIGTGANHEVNNGNISHGEGSDITSCTDDEWTNCGDKWINNNGSVKDRAAVNLLVEDQIAKLEDPNNNDNGVEDDINATTNRLDCSGGCEIDAGSYYLEEISGSNPDIEFNTTGGDINIAIGNSIKNIDKMTIDGPNRVNIYLNDSFQPNNGFKVGNVSSSKPADQFWMYLKTDSLATIANTGTFVGVLYGPGGKINDGAEIQFGGPSAGCGGCEFYGGALGDITTQINNAEVLFDEALTSVKPVTVPASVVKITYLHITVNEIRVED